MIERVLVGLGNPGDEYDLTRHNIGFMMVDWIADFFKFPQFQKKHNALISKGEINNHKIALVKPMTYMNNSGVPLQAFLQFFKIKSEQVIVIHDEIEIETARAKMKFAGGHAGHNGLKSIDLNLTKNYWRLRLGVDRPKGEQPVSSYVLKRFKTEELDKIILLKQLIIEHIDDILLLQFERFNSVAGKFFKEKFNI